MLTATPAKTEQVMSLEKSDSDRFIEDCVRLEQNQEYLPRQLDNKTTGIKPIIERALEDNDWATLVETTNQSFTTAKEQTLIKDHIAELLENEDYEQAAQALKHIKSKLYSQEYGNDLASNPNKTLSKRQWMGSEKAPEKEVLYEKFCEIAQGKIEESWEDFASEVRMAGKQERDNFVRETAEKMKRTVTHVHDFGDRYTLGELHTQSEKMAQLVKKYGADYSKIREEVSQEFENIMEDSQSSNTQIQEAISTLAAINPGILYKYIDDSDYAEFKENIVTAVARYNPEELFYFERQGQITSQEFTAVIDVVATYNPEYTLKRLDKFSLDQAQKDALALYCLEYADASHIALQTEQEPYIARLIEENPDVRTRLVDRIYEDFVEKNETLGQQLAYMNKFYGNKLLETDVTEAITKIIEETGRKTTLREALAWLPELEEHPEYAKTAFEIIDRLSEEVIKTVNELNIPLTRDRTTNADEVKLGMEIRRRYEFATSDDINIAIVAATLKESLKEVNSQTELENELDELYFSTNFPKRYLLHFFMEEEKSGAVIDPSTLIFEHKLIPQNRTEEETEWIKDQMRKSITSFETDLNSGLGIQQDGETYRVLGLVETLYDLQDKELTDRYCKFAWSDPAMSMVMAQSVYIPTRWVKGELDESQIKYYGIGAYLLQNIDEDTRNKLMETNNVKLVDAYLPVFFPDEDERRKQFALMQKKFPEYGLFPSYEDWYNFPVRESIEDMEGNQRLLKLISEFGSETITELLENVSYHEAQSSSQYSALVKVAFVAKELDPTIDNKLVAEFIKRKCDETDPVELRKLEKLPEDHPLVKMEDLLRANRERVAQVVINNPDIEWRNSYPKLFNWLVNPENGDAKYFPNVIVDSLYDIEPATKQKLNDLYDKKDLRVGTLSKAQLAEDLLYLAGVEDHDRILTQIVEASNLAKDDPKKIREIFRFIRNLENPAEVFGAEQPQNLNIILSNIKAVVAKNIALELGLEEADSERVLERLEYLLSEKVVNISTTLLKAYKLKRCDQAAELTRSFIGAIVMDDFEDWRYRSAEGRAQWEPLRDHISLRAWRDSVEIKDINRVQLTEEERREGLTESLVKIVADAKMHITMENSDFEVSEQRIATLHEQMKQANKGLERQGIPDERKEMLMAKVDTILVELSLIEQLQEVEGFKPSFDNKALENLKSTLYSIQASIRTLRENRVLVNTNQPISDIEEALKLVEMYNDHFEYKEITCKDTDDPLVLLNIGVIPRETCQSWRGGMYNQCLPAYVGDTNKRAIIATTETGQTLGRSVIKGVTYRLDKKDKEIPFEGAILMEPIYSLVDTNAATRVIAQVALEKAYEADVSLLVTLYTGTKAHGIFKEEAGRLGMELVEKQEVEVDLPQSRNNVEYSDMLGGQVSGGKFKVMCCIARRKETVTRLT